MAFAYCLVNVYEDGNHCTAYHVDSEALEPGFDTVVSISLGATRRFHLKHKQSEENNNARHDFDLENGEMLVMRGQTQHYFKHRIAQTKKKVGRRINLTFGIAETD